MDDVLISVIIPVFNAEEYIGRCLDSVFCQDFANFEIIAVNDGSVDGSLAILKRYSKDSRLVIVDKANQGVSSARNEGLKIARGIYAVFIDSDDLLEKKALSAMYNEAIRTDSDVSIFGFNVKFISDEDVRGRVALNVGNKVLNKYEKELLAASCLWPLKITDEAFNVAASWAKIYRIDFLRACRIQFEDNLIRSEDVVFNFEAYLRANRISHRDSCVYRYFIREGSSSHRIYTDISDINRRIINSVKMKYDEFGGGEILSFGVGYFYLSLFYDAVFLSPSEDGEPMVKQAQRMRRIYCNGYKTEIEKLKYNYLTLNGRISLALFKNEMFCTYLCIRRVKGVVVGIVSFLRSIAK